MNYSNTNSSVTSNVAATSNSLGSTPSLPPQPSSSLPPVKKETFFSKLKKNKPVLGVLGILFFAVLVGGVLFINSIIAGRNNVNNGPSRASQAGLCVYSVTTPASTCTGGCVTTNDCSSGLACIGGKCLNSNCSSDSTCSCVSPSISPLLSPSPSATPTLPPVTPSPSPSVTPSLSPSPSATPPLTCGSACQSDADCKAVDPALTCATQVTQDAGANYRMICVLSAYYPPLFTCTPPISPSPSPLTYSCNSACDNDIQCQTANPAFTCYFNSCRLGANPSSQTCAPIVASPSPSVTYNCNGSCTTDAQCQTANAGYVCSQASGNICRLGSNISSDTCQPAAQTYACNSACTSDTQCQTVSSSYVCYNNFCRLGSNAPSTSCQPLPPLSPSPAVTYNCNGSCSLDSQCQTANASYVCSKTYGNICRLGSNASSESCQPLPQTYACNSACTSDVQCQSVNSNYVCYTNLCRMGTNVTSTSCQTPIFPSPTPAVVYNCNGSCTTDAQCQSGNAGYICSRDNGNVCRLDSNRSSVNCQPAPQTYACNSACSSDAQCQTVSGSYVCYGGACRMGTNVGSTSCQPIVYVPPSPRVGCNQLCSSNSDCASSSYICADTSNGRRCRMDSYVNSDTCTPPTVVYTQPAVTPRIVYVQSSPLPRASAAPVKPAQLPVSGSTDTLKFVLAGAGAVILGALSLLLL